MRRLDELEIQSVSGAAFDPLMFASIYSGLRGFNQETTMYYWALGAGTFGAVIGGVTGVLIGGPSKTGAALSGLGLGLVSGASFATLGVLEAYVGYTIGSWFAPKFES